MFIRHKIRAGVSAMLAIGIMAMGALFAPGAKAAAMGDSLEAALLGHVFQGSAYTAPGTLYVGLSTSACSDSGFGTEVSGGAYARVAVAANGSNWTGPTANNGTVSNANAVTFPAPSGANWGTVTHWFIASASSAGSLLWCSALTASKTINDGDSAPSFAAGAMTVQIDN